MELIAFAKFVRRHLLTGPLPLKQLRYHSAQCGCLVVSLNLQIHGCIWRVAEDRKRTQDQGRRGQKTRTRPGSPTTENAHKTRVAENRKRTQDQSRLQECEERGMEVFGKAHYQAPRWRRRSEVCRRDYCWTRASAQWKNSCSHDRVWNTAYDLLRQPAVSCALKRLIGVRRRPQALVACH